MVGWFYFKQLRPSFTDVDPCARAVCKNGGICSDLGGSKVECSCPPGFKGKTCEGGRHQSFIKLSHAQKHFYFIFFVVKPRSIFHSWFI